MNQYYFGDGDVSDCMHTQEMEDCTEAEEAAYRLLCEELNNAPFEGCELDKVEPIDHVSLECGRCQHER